MSGPRLGAQRDQNRSAELRRMKLGATAMLIAASATFVVFRALGEHGWKGYVIAATEAAMVGGIADWFAVTALFRHPLRIPIPHTAIIPTRKDQIGESLGEFVQENFLDPTVLSERVESAHLGSRVGTWMTAGDNAKIAAARLADGLVALAEVIDDEAIQEAIQSLLRDRVQRTPAAPVVARALDAAVESEQHQAAMDSILGGVLRGIEENKDVLRTHLGNESPWWVPPALDDRVFGKLMSGLYSFLSDVVANPQHELRHHLTLKMNDVAERLRTDPDLAARVDAIRDQLLERPEIGSWVQQLWSTLESDLRSATNDPDSNLQARLSTAIERIGGRIADDPELQARADEYATRAVRYLADQSKSEVADLIGSTVAKWDADDTSHRIELQIGRDLQYIRINGTLVGALIGIVIHTVGQMVS